MHRYLVGDVTKLLSINMCIDTQAQTREARCPHKIARATAPIVFDPLSLSENRESVERALIPLTPPPPVCRQSPPIGLSA